MVLSEEMATNLYTCGNFLPAVSYVACDRIMVEWWHKPTFYGPCLPTVGQHIIGRQLNLDGSPAYSGYSRLSWDVGPVYYSTPSVSGRYISPFGPVNSIFSTYTRSDNFKVRYKSSSCGIVQMKKEPVAPEVRKEAEIAPNPFTDRLQINLTGREQMVEIFNLEGQRVHAWEGLVPGESENELSWQADALPAGVYVIRLTEAAEVVVKKVVKM